MRSLRRVIKSDLISSSDQIISIPDEPQLPSFPTSAQGEGFDPSSALQIQGGQMYNQIVQQAKQEGEGLRKRLMQLAHQEREALLSQANEEAQALRDTARQEGYSAGLQQKKEEIDRLLREFNRLMEELRVQQQEFLDDYTAEIQIFSLEVASKIMNRQISLDESEMKELVKSAVGSVKDADWLIVKLSGQMPGLMKQLAQDFPPGAKIDGRRVDLVESDIPPGSCLIETPMGSIDASIQAQLDKLREYFKKV